MKFLKTVLGFVYVRKVHISAIALGGSLGALARIGICELFTNQILAIFVCNVFGSFLLASAIELRRRIHPDVENMVSIGFCGGLSIFASFSRDSVLALAADNYVLFFTNLFANFALCVAAVFLAGWIATQIRTHRDALRDKRRKIAVALHLAPKKKTLGEKMGDIGDKIKNAVESATKGDDK